VNCFIHLRYTLLELKRRNSYLLPLSLTLGLRTNSFQTTSIKEQLLEEMLTFDTGLQGNSEMEGPTRPTGDSRPHIQGGHSMNVVT